MPKTKHLKQVKEIRVIAVIMLFIALILYLVLEPFLNQEPKSPPVALKSVENLSALKDLPKSYEELEDPEPVDKEPEDKTLELSPPIEPEPIKPEPAVVEPVKPYLPPKLVKKEPTEKEKAIKEGIFSGISVPGFKSIQKQEKKDDTVLKVSLKKPGSKYMIQAGTTVPAITVSAINSDLPGHVVARISRNIYDSVSGRSLLLPQGSLILGQYGSDVKMNQRRVGVFWNEIKLPNGSSIELGKGMPGTGDQGDSGLTGSIDNHYFGNAVSIFSIALLNSTAKHISNSNNGSLEGDVSEDVSNDVAETGSDLIKNQLQLKPTIKISIGSTLKILITKDLLFGAPYNGK